MQNYWSGRLRCLFELARLSSVHKISSRSKDREMVQDVILKTHQNRRIRLRSVFSVVHKV